MSRERDCPKNLEGHAKGHGDVCSCHLSKACASVLVAASTEQAKFKKQWQELTQITILLQHGIEHVPRTNDHN